MDPGTSALVGAYRLVRRLGRGATGVVYQATHPELGEVAIKMLHPEVAGDEGARARFVREAETLARLRHRNIVTIFEGGVSDDAPFLAMELLSGSTLAAKLTSGEPMSLARKLDIVTQLCDGLQFVHERGVIHRDVKPANVWLMSNGGVKLLDFGTARILGSTFTRAGDVIGSAAYMAPEQVGAREVDGRADVFAAGVILYQLLAGRRPFAADSIGAVMNKILHERPVPVESFVPGLSRDVAIAVETALEKDVGLRYLQAADFGSDLRLARYAVEQDAADARRPGQTSGARPAPLDPAESADTLIAQPRTGGTSLPIAVATALTVEHPAADPAAASHRRTPGTSRPEPVPAVTTVPRVRTDPAAVTPQRPIRARALERPAPQRVEPRPSPASFAAGVLLWMRSRPRPVAAGIGLIAAIVLVAVVVTRQLWAGPEFRIDVRSVPSGAFIEIDGVQTGQRTPAVVAVTTRPGRLSVAAPGYEAAYADVAAASTSEPLVRSLTLRRLVRVDSTPAGARILVNGQDTGFVTPANVPVDAQSPPSLQLELGRQFRGDVRITDATLTSGVVNVSLSQRPGPSPDVQLVGGTGPTSLVDGGEGPAPSPAPSSKTVVVGVHVTGSYPFEITGCGRSSAAAAVHEFDVNAPCVLRLRAPKYYLDETRTIAASAGRVEIAAPQLARVQLRSKFEVCTVILNDHAVGSPPVDLELAAGTYRVAIQCRDRTYSIRALTIEPGQSFRRLDDFLP